MSSYEFGSESRTAGRRESDRPQQRQSEDRTMRADGLRPHDEFSPVQRRAGLAILDYEEGESI